MAKTRETSPTATYCNVSIAPHKKLQQGLMSSTCRFLFNISRSSHKGRCTIDTVHMPTPMHKVSAFSSKAEISLDIFLFTLLAFLWTLTLAPHKSCSTRSFSEGNQTNKAVFKSDQEKGKPARVSSLRSRSCRSCSISLHCLISVQ